MSDLWHTHLRGEETSLNPLGLADALIGAMNHSCDLAIQSVEKDDEMTAVEKEDTVKVVQHIHRYTDALKKAIHNTFRYGQGTRDMAGPNGLTTENFVDKVAWRLGRYMASMNEEIDPQHIVAPSRSFRRNCESLYRCTVSI